MSTAVVQVTVRHRDGSDTTFPGQATVCPHLAVVPRFDGIAYGGDFTLVHVPTGWVLPTLGDDLTPELARYAATHLLELDWSSPDRADYQDGSYGRAWLAALRATEELQICAVDDEQVPGLVADAEARVRAETGGTSGGVR